MAINEEDSNNNPNRPTQDPRQPNASSTSWSFHDQGLFEAPIPKSVGSEFYNKFKEKLVDIYKSANKSVEINIIDMSRSVEPALDFSCILVATRLKEHLKLGVAFHVLLLVSTGDGEIPVYTEQFMDRQVQVNRMPSDAINDVLLKKAYNRIKKAYDTDLIRFVDGTVVPANFSIEDANAMQALALNSAMAGVTELNTHRAGFEDLNLAKLNKQGQSSVEVSFQRQQLVDAASNIFRSDVTIAFTDRKGGDNQRDRQLNSGDRTVKFSELSGFMDVIWFPAVEQNAYASPFSQTSAVSTQKYVPRLTITNINAAYAPTPGSVLLSLSTALAMRNPNTWIQGFKPQMTAKNQRDITDIGALNYEGNMPVPQGNGTMSPDNSGYGKMIDTKADDFKSEQLGIYIRTLFRPELLLSLDVPEFGPQSHYLSVFSSAAASRPNTGAYDRIIRAANELTSGEFSRHFTKCSPIFATNSERIHAGSWVDVNGQTRDLRDLDYIAVANLVGDRFPQLIRDWSDTFLRLDYPETQRLEARRTLINKLTGDTAKFTGWYQRVTFTSAFLVALDNAIASHNLRVITRTPMSGNDFYNQRGVANYATAGMLGFGPSYIQAGGYSTGPAAAAAYPPTFRQF